MGRPLYVEPALIGQGIGGELIALAKRERPTGLRLWTFETNVQAQRFYERHGFSLRDRTAGENEEGAPDVLYVWDGQDVDHCRGRRAAPMPPIDAQ